MSSELNRTPKMAADDAKRLHDSISQVASIRIQAELLLLGLEQDSSTVRHGLDTIVDLTQGLQEVLTELLAGRRG